MDTRRETHEGTKDDSQDPVKRDDASADPTTETPRGDDPTREPDPRDRGSNRTEKGSDR